MEVGLISPCFWDRPSQGLLAANPSWSGKGQDMLFPCIAALEREEGEISPTSGYLPWLQEAPRKPALTAAWK